jgi:hypothetical protein
MLDHGLLERLLASGDDTRGRKDLAQAWGSDAIGRSTGTAVRARPQSDRTGGRHGLALAIGPAKRKLTAIPEAILKFNRNNINITLVMCLFD